MTQRQMRKCIAAAGIAGSLVALSACASTASPDAAQGSKGGAYSTTVADEDSVTLGVIVSKTGFLQPEATGIYSAFEAVIKSINHDGGINGRQIKLTTADDQSTAAGNLAAAKVLVAAKKVFAVVDISGVQSGGGAYLEQQGVPTFAAGLDTAVSTYKNFFSPEGGYDPNPKGTATTFGLVFKQLGATKVGSLGLSISQASQGAAKAGVGSSASAGLKAGYLNTTVTPGVSNWTPYVLGFKNSGTDGFFGVIDEPNTVNFLTAAKQQGLEMKSLITNVYVNELLSGATKSVMQGVYVPARWLPAQIKNAATDREHAILRQYGNITESGDFRTSTGYVLGLLVKEGLSVGGKDLSRQSVQTELHQVTDWEADGLAPKPVDFSKQITDPPAATTGAGNCLWVLQVKGAEFVPLSEKPTCGTKTTLK